MSADLFVAFYGVRYDIAVDSPEVDLLEAETHPLIVTARENALDVWWSGLTNDNETIYPLFIGKQLALVGHGYDMERRVSAEDLLAAVHEMPLKFQNAGLQEIPELILQIEVAA